MGKVASVSSAFCRIGFVYLDRQHRILSGIGKGSRGLFVLIDNPAIWSQADGKITAVRSGAESRT